MIEHFDTITEAKLRRVQLLDASAFSELPSFLTRYTKASQEEGLRYRHKLYELVDTAQFPCDIDWPSPPIPQTIEDFNASLPKQEAIL